MSESQKLPAVDQMQREWLAWHQVCKQLSAINVDINTERPLACAIRVWGEELTELRRQEPQHGARALAERRQEYEPHQINDNRS